MTQPQLFPPPPNPTRTTVFNLRRVIRAATDVYIGRAGHGEIGTWGNPYVRVPGSDEAMQNYCRDLVSRWRTPDGPFASAVELLGGHQLLCFCLSRPWDTSMDGPLRCHGQPLALGVDLARGFDCPAAADIPGLRSVCVR